MLKGVGCSALDSILDKVHLFRLIGTNSTSIFISKID